MENNSQLVNSMLDAQVNAFKLLKENMPYDAIDKVVDLLLNNKGRLFLSAIGKSGYVARKIASSFASTGSLAYFVHPSEASHGDLGMISKEDIVIILSNSGNTQELENLINYCKGFNIPIIAMTSNPESMLAKNSTHILAIPKLSEISSIGAPTISTLLMMAFGDILMSLVHVHKSFEKDDYSKLHPGGSIGVNLNKIKNVMYKKEDLPIVQQNDSLLDILHIMASYQLGCVLVVDDDNDKIMNIITKDNLNDILNLPDSRNVIAKDFISESSVITISEDSFIKDARELMKSKNITYLPVIDEKNKLVGLLDSKIV